jgi:hypothetical protein
LIEDLRSQSSWDVLDSIHYPRNDLM